MKTGYYHELLTTEMMKLLGSAKDSITNNGDGENVHHSEITEVLLVQCNIVNSDYQHDSRVLYTCIPNYSFGQLLEISYKNSEFLYNGVWLLVKILDC